MSFWQGLYQLLITPLQLIFEVIFGFSYLALKNVGLSIFPLSLAVNLLLLPFYNRADALQQEELDHQKEMEPAIAHIKKTFRGDERFMMTQTYYRQMHYKPIYSLKSALPLLLQVPFFIAAYNFLSDLPLLSGAGLGFLKDLGKPDGLLAIGGFSVNVLPVLMTVINIISSEIYTKGQPVKEKLKLHAMALIFLVLLYNSPSGLVLYWTLNNVFSLAKNLVATVKDRDFAKRVACGVIGVLVLGFAALMKEAALQPRLLVGIAGLACFLPLLSRLSGSSEEAKRRKAEKEKRAAIAAKHRQQVEAGAAVEGVKEKGSSRPFLYGAVTLVLLTGWLIPSGVMSASPSEFVSLTAYRSPLIYIVFSMLLATGMFLIWGGLFYFLAGPKARKVMTIVFAILGIAGLVNYMGFGKNLGTLTPDLQFTLGKMYFSTGESMINILVVGGIAALVTVLFQKKDAIIKFVLPVLAVAVLALCVSNTYKIAKKLPRIKFLIENQTDEKASFRLSTTGENVVVLMMDRQISKYIPYLLQERPDLRESLAGFVWYPNTLSFGANTNTGSPALFGGYEYTPEKLNARTDMLLEEKQNEALRVMPVLFASNDFEVTVCDPPLAGYGVVPDLSIYDDHPEIRRFNTQYGQFYELDESIQSKESIWKRNFFCYSFMKIMPVAVQESLYQDGSYFSSEKPVRVQRLVSGSEAQGMDDGFLNAYGALCSYDEMTVVTDEPVDTFLMICNDTAHDSMLLEEPSYEPAVMVDNTGFDAAHTERFTYDGVTMSTEYPYMMALYESNMCALIHLCEWLDYLREAGVYDNTRIIVVADHGYGLSQFDDMIFGDNFKRGMSFNPQDATAYNPTLMVKDFGSSGEFSADYSFMTNADTPVLACSGLIDSPQNPFSGTDLETYGSQAKNAEKLYVFYSNYWQADQNNGEQFKPGVWFSLSGQDVFALENWETVGKEYPGE